MKLRILAAALCLAVLTACGSVNTPELLEPVSLSVQTTTVQRGNVYDMTVLVFRTRLLERQFLS